MILQASDPSFADRYAWRLPLRDPRLADPHLTPQGMTAAEQMFFLGAPLAHVVEYEKRLRVQRVKGPRRGAARLSRIAIRRLMGEQGAEPRLSVAAD